MKVILVSFLGHKKNSVSSFYIFAVVKLSFIHLHRAYAVLVNASSVHQCAHIILQGESKTSFYIWQAVK